MSDENNKILGDFEASLASAEYAQEEQIQKKWDIYTPGKRRMDAHSGDEALVNAVRKLSPSKNIRVAEAVATYGFKRTKS